MNGRPSKILGTIACSILLEIEPDREIPRFITLIGSPWIRQMSFCPGRSVPKLERGRLHFLVLSGMHHAADSISTGHPSLSPEEKILIDFCRLLQTLADSPQLGDVVQRVLPLPFQSPRDGGAEKGAIWVDIYYTDFYLG
jgi:hypothetical protein